MSKSRLFGSNEYKRIERDLTSLLNAQEEFLTASTAQSTRAVGDAIQGIIGDHLESLLGNLCTEYSADFARRAMADLAFTDIEGFYYVVDVKTHRADTRFNMPNLTSVERLARFYEDDRNYFALLIVSYALKGTRAAISQVRLSPIEWFAWDCLTVGALGWGQIQIANSNYINIQPSQLRKDWMLQLCDVMLEFYPKEIAKISDRIERFKDIRDFWQAKPG